LHKTAAFYTEQCTSPLISHNFGVSQGSSNRSLNNYGFISNSIFKSFTHVHKSLNNETKKITNVELEIQLCAWR